MLHNVFALFLVLLMVTCTFPSWAELGDVAIFSEATAWISKDDADIQRAIVFDNLKNDVPAVGDVVYATDAEIGTWAEERIDDGKADILIIFGWFPTTLYTPGNLQVDDSIAERFLYGGNIILNCADYVFYVTEGGGANGENGLKTIININADMWSDGTAITPTDDGKKYTPALVDFTSHRTFKAAQIVDPWSVEVKFGDNGAGFFDPGIIKLKDSSGRVGICMQNTKGDLPRGQVLIEMIDFISQQPDILKNNNHTIGPNEVPNENVNHDGLVVEEIPVPASRDESLMKMYWTSVFEIRRANLDGTDVEDILTFTLGFEAPHSIALDVEGGKIYWTDLLTHKIHRANLDGSDVEDIIQGVRSYSIALDVEGGKIYWVERHDGKIRRANLDGSDVEDILTQRFGSLSGIALDVGAGKMYWTDFQTSKIRRANLDGSDVEDILTFTPGFENPVSITLDVGAGKMYWTALPTGKIRRANLDGSDVEDIFTQRFGDTSRIAIGMITPVNPTTRKEDVNGDGVVDIADLVAVNSALLTDASGNNADVNQDGIINIADLIWVAAAIATSEAAVAAAPAVIAAQAAKQLTPADVQRWIAEARHANLADPTSLQGIRLLEQLLSVLIPKETALLANYPNPFNPETWIPYQLAKPAAVTLNIYAVDGKLVRRLDLGHQPIGIYHGKNRAAYWDGRNAVGEPVASGVYFYTLKAGEFTATRKMLIRK